MGEWPGSTEEYISRIHFSHAKHCEGSLQVKMNSSVGCLTESSWSRKLPQPKNDLDPKENCGNNCLVFDLCGFPDVYRDQLGQIGVSNRTSDARATTAYWDP
jgi:hypothetical protein